MSPRLTLLILVLAPLLAAQTKPADSAAAEKNTSAAAQNPKLAAGLEAGTYKYQAKISMGGQELALSLTTTIKDENGAWNVSDVTETPVGSVTDSAILDKRTLEPRGRSFAQGPMAVNLEYSRGKASGTMNMGNGTTKVSADLGGPLFADGPGAPQSIGCLPLAEGYTADIRNFDIQRQAARTLKVKVAGSESVTVPAGTFDTYKVELSSDNPGTAIFWIDKKSRRAVKIATGQPQAGGAMMTAELLP